MPGPTWSVVGTGDFTGDGNPDVLLENVASNVLQLWEISAADGQPTVISKINLPATVPPGFSVAGIGQVNGLGAADLLVRNATTGQQLTLTLTTSLGDGLTGSPQQTSLPLPAYFQVVGAGDLDGDGVGDLLLRDTLNGHLIADLTRPTGQQNVFVDLGQLDADWVVAGVENITGARGPDDILFQNTVTGLTYVWVLGTGARVTQTLDLDLGEGSTSLIFDFAQGTQPATISGTVFQDININGVQDPGQPGIAGVTVYLDLADTGSLQAGDPTTTTDSNGNYLFIGESPGTYTVREVLYGGVLLDTPSSGSYQVTVTSGETSPARTSRMCLAALPCPCRCR